MTGSGVISALILGVWSLHISKTTWFFRNGHFEKWWENNSQSLDRSGLDRSGTTLDPRAQFTQDPDLLTKYGTCCCQSGVHTTGKKDQRDWKQNLRLRSVSPSYELGLGTRIIFWRQGNAKPQNRKNLGSSCLFSHQKLSFMSGDVEGWWQVMPPGGMGCLLVSSHNVTSV